MGSLLAPPKLSTMADAAAAPAKKAKAPKKPAAKPTHPAYAVMVAAAVKALKERSGSSRQAILKYIVANYTVGDEKKAASRLKLALKKGVASGALNQVKGAGASGSFKVAKEEAKPKVAAKKPKAAAKKPAAKKAAKPAAKKAAAKKPAVKAAKKPAAKAAKKPAAKVAKKAVKKPAAAKKPVAKKAVKKPAAKKVAKK